MIPRGWRLWIPIVLSIIGVGGVVFTVVTHYTDRPIHQLDAVVRSCVEFEAPPLGDEDEHTVELSVLFDGQTVENLNQLLVEIRNSGNTVLKGADNPVLYLQFPETARVLSIDVGDKPEPHMQFQAEPDVVENRVLISFGLLKPGESVPISIFLEGRLPDDILSFDGRSLARRRVLTTAELSEGASDLRMATILAISIAGSVGSALVLVVGLALLALYFLRQLRSVPVFQDAGTSGEGWEDIGAGRVSADNKCPGWPLPCLRKDGAGDPNGAFKRLGFDVRRGLILSAWVFHPAEREAGPAGRLAIENDTFGGYGFCLTNNCSTLMIEKRDAKRPKTLARQSVELRPNTWYKFALVVEAEGMIHLQVFDGMGTRVASIDPVEDESFSSFDRIAIHGGGPYFVRNITVEATG